MRTYLGDGLYAVDHGFQIELYTGNENAKENSVYLDGPTLAGFLSFIEISRGVKITIDSLKKEGVGISQ